MVQLNKKGSWAFLLMAAGLALAVFAVIFAITTSVDVKQQDFIGDNQLRILHADTEMQKLLFFIDQSAKYASQLAVIDLAEKGGYYDKSGCGNYLDYNSWRNIISERDQEGKIKVKLKECTNPNLNDGFGSHFNDKFTTYISFYPQIIPYNYDTTLQQGNKLTIIGNARQNIEVQLSRTTKLEGGIVTPEELPVELEGINITNEIEIAKKYVQEKGSNYWRPRKTTPQYIILHHTASSRGKIDEFAVKSLVDTHCSRWPDICGVAYHFIVGKNGEVAQTTPIELKTNGAVGFNENGIHIAMLGCFAPSPDPEYRRSACVGEPSMPTEEIVQSTAKLIAGLMKKYNIPIENVLGHHHTFLVRGVTAEKSCPGTFFLEKYPGWDNFLELVQKYREVEEKEELIS